MSKTATKMKWWIKERYNPQIGTYFVACGQLSKTAARMKERSLYGDNNMHSFETEEAYTKRLEHLRATGERVDDEPQLQNNPAAPHAE